MRYPVQRTPEEWHRLLTPVQYAVLREAATERAWTGPLLEEHRPGRFHCAGCGNHLFDADTKFDSGCGWPSFYQAVRPDAVELLEDRSHGMLRTEVRCAGCGSHLGHVFPDGWGTPTGDRFCMNSVALQFTPLDDE